MTSPKRIQLRRTKGWRKPEGVIVVSRPSRWGNPFRVGEVVTHPAYSTEAGPGPITAETATLLFESYAWPRWTLDADENSVRYVDLARRELAGHDLACWCPLGQPCHADVLLALANPKDPHA